MTKESTNISLIVIPEHHDFYQSLISCVFHDKLDGLTELLASNYEKVASKTVFYSASDKQNSKISEYEVFWFNLFEIWSVLKKTQENDDLAQYSEVIEKFAAQSNEQAKLFEWNIYASLALIAVGNTQPAGVYLNQAAQIFTDSFVSLDPQDLSWRSITSKAVAMIELLYKMGEVNFVEPYVSILMVGIAKSPNTANAAETSFYFGSKLIAYANPLALPCFETTVSLCRQGENYPGLVVALTNLGAACNDLFGNSEKGLEYSLEAIRIAEEHGLTNDTHAIFDAGNILLSLGRDAEAEEFLRRAVALGKQRNEYQGVVHATRLLARVFIQRGLTQEAANLFTEAIAIGTQTNETDATHMAFAEYAYLLAGQGDKAGSRRNLRKALKLAEQTGNKKVIERYQQEINALSARPKKTK